MAVSTWEAREQPLLEAIAEREGDRQLSNHMLAEATGLEQRTVDIGLRALLDAEYIAAHNRVAELCYLLDIRLLERGRRAVRQWPPSSEAAAEAFVNLVNVQIETASDSVERSKWVRLRDAVTGLGGEAIKQLSIAYLKQMGGLP
jgi:DNA-binding IclR family transcriptional regulator